MKKRLLLLLIFMFTLVNSAYAVKVDYHGSAAVGVIGTSNANMFTRARAVAKAESSIIGSGKVRLRTEITSDDKQAKFVYGVEVGANDFGRDWDYSGDSIDIENRFAYIESSIPGLHEKTFLRAGLQKTGINKWLWSETCGGLTLHGQGEKKWMLGWFRGIEMDNFVDDDDSDLFVAKVDFDTYKSWDFNLFGVYALDFHHASGLPATTQAQADSDQYWLGGSGNLKKDEGKVFASADLIYQGGDVNGTDKVSGLLANLVVGKKVNNKCKLSLNALYVSGDDNPADTSNHAFQSIDIDSTASMIFFEGGLNGSFDKFAEDAPHKIANGFITYGIDADFKLCEKSNIKTALKYLVSDDNVNLASGALSADLGYEFNLLYSYELNKNLTYKVAGAYLFADELSHEIFGNNDDVSMLSTAAIFKF